MYKYYVKEREGLETIEVEDKGFICYKLVNDLRGTYCLINDYFVMPEHRKKGIGYELADLVFEKAKSMGYEKVCCQSDEAANNHDLSALTILKFGFKHYHKDGSINHYIMGVSEWEKRSKRLQHQSQAV